MKTANKRAASPNAAMEISTPRQYLTFTVGREIFGIDVLAAKEIIEYEQITVVPMMPASIRGVVNLRGAVVPVIDLSARFGAGTTEAKKRTCIVIVEMAQLEAGQSMGLLVDSVNQVVDIATAEIEPPPSFGARIRTDFIDGMGKLNGKFIILLNLEHVLSMDELAAMAEVSVGEQTALDAAPV